MLTFALLILAGVQDAPQPAPVKLVVPPGACKPTIDGAAVTLDGLRAATAQWAAAQREVRLEPDARADPACVQAVLERLGAAGAGTRFPIKFADNDVFSGLEGH